MGISTIKSKLKRGLALTQKESGDLWEYIHSLEKQQHWIPVTEKLPDEQRTIGKYIFSENVLGTEGYTIRKAYYNYTTKEWFDGNEEMRWTEITHWMPLPEGYKTERREDERLHYE